VQLKFTSTQGLPSLLLLLLLLRLRKPGCVDGDLNISPLLLVFSSEQFPLLNVEKLAVYYIN